MAYYNSIKIFNILSKSKDNKEQTNLNNKPQTNLDNLNGGNTKLLFSDLEFDISDDDKFEGGKNFETQNFKYSLNNETDKEYIDNNDMFLPKIISKINVSSTEEEIKKDLGDKSVGTTSAINTENMSLTTLEEIYGKKFENGETQIFEQSSDNEIYTPTYPDDETILERIPNDKIQISEHNSNNIQNFDDFTNIYNMYGGELELDDSSDSSNDEEELENEDYENSYIAGTNRFNETNNDSIYNIEIESLSNSEDDEEIEKENDKNSFAEDSLKNEDSSENSSGNEDNQIGGESINNIISDLGDNKDNDDVKAYIKGCKTKGLIGGITKNKIYKFNFYPYN